jgi:Lar family restriction alleviation protein
MSDTQQLLPCPFCGEAPSTSEREDESLWSHAKVIWYRVSCSNCDVQFSSEEPGEAASRWNERIAAEPSGHQQQIPAAIAEQDYYIELADKHRKELEQRISELTKDLEYLRSGGMSAAVLTQRAKEAERKLAAVIAECSLYEKYPLVHREKILALVLDEQPQSTEATSYIKYLANMIANASGATYEQVASDLQKVNFQKPQSTPAEREEKEGAD